MTLTSTANPPSEDIKDMLVSSSSGLGVTFGTDLFIASLPDSPNVCTSINDTGGFDQGQYGYEYPAIQILHRNTDYSTGHAFMRDLKYYLHLQRNMEIWNSTRYIQIAVKSDILYLGMDDKNRYQFSLNFQIQRSGT
jgi:hypothetical protein